MNQIIIYKWIIPIIAAIVITIFIRKYFFFITLISSYSMYPFIKPNDMIFTVRIRSFQKIKRGDVLVFYSKELHQTVIKRVIGLPNDFIEIKNEGAVYINQKKLDEPYVEYQNILNGKFHVPEKSYLFLGDNRAYSRDSRSWLEPFISEKDIRGKALFCIFPLRKV